MRLAGRFVRSAALFRIGEGPAADGYSEVTETHTGAASSSLFIFIVIFLSLSLIRRDHLYTRASPFFSPFFVVAILHLLVNYDISL